jgi:hypothetical protein
MEQRVPLIPHTGGVLGSERYVELGHLFAEFLDRGFQVYSGARPVRSPARICVTGAALGLPGVDRVFDDANIDRILRGDQFIDLVPEHHTPRQE